MVPPTRFKVGLLSGLIVPFVSDKGELAEWAASPRRPEGLFWTFKFRCLGIHVVILTQIWALGMASLEEST